MTVYTVESGDSVYSIARKFGVPASRIVTDNELSNPSRLTVGQSIVILYPTETYIRCAAATRLTPYHEEREYH